MSWPISSLRLFWHFDSLIITGEYRTYLSWATGETPRAIGSAQRGFQRWYQSEMRRYRLSSMKFSVSRTSWRSRQRYWMFRSVGDFRRGGYECLPYYRYSFKWCGVLLALCACPGCAVFLRYAARWRAVNDVAADDANWLPTLGTPDEHSAVFREKKYLCENYSDGTDPSGPSDKVSKKELLVCEQKKALGTSREWPSANL